MKIVVVGAGNIGTQFAVHCAEKGHQVILYCSKPERINKELMVVNEQGKCIHRAEIFCATASPELAFTGADLIFITYPAYCMDQIADVILPYADSNLMLCLVPGTGGGECAFHKVINKGATVFGLQRVPSVARLVEYGKKVRATGYRNELFVASLPLNQAEYCADVIAGLFDMKCKAMANYLNLTLTPSNPILHTTRLSNLFHDYKEGLTYPDVPLFYEDWNDETSRLLFLCDEEVQNICRELNEFDLSNVKSLRIHYESDTPEAMTRKISSITGFKGLKSPAILTEHGWIPDLSSRYFTADFPYGLSILVQIAKLLNVRCENMTETLEWYYSIMGNCNEFRFSDYGINTLSDFLEFYSR